MTFKDSLKILNIEDFEERIWNSNSKGELFHLDQYILMAKSMENPENFRDWFLKIVTYADENWQRPESVFQHILKFLQGE